MPGDVQEKRFSVPNVMSAAQPNSALLVAAGGFCLVPCISFQWCGYPAPNDAICPIPLFIHLRAVGCALCSLCQALEPSTPLLASPQSAPYLCTTGRPKSANGCFSLVVQIPGTSAHAAHPPCPVGASCRESATEPRPDRRSLATAEL